MKTYGSLYRVALVAIGSFILGGCASHKATYFGLNSAAIVEEVRGSAEVSRSGSAWNMAQTGNTIHPGGRVRTGSDGTVTLNLGSNGGTVEVIPDSLLELEQIGPTGGNSEVLATLNVLEGGVRGDTKNPPRGKILVRTRGGTYEIR